MSDVFDFFQSFGSMTPDSGHLEPEVVPLAGPLADAGEDRVAARGLRDVVDQLHDEDGLADAGAAEEAGLAALRVRLEEVDDLDPRLEHLDASSTAPRTAGASRWIDQRSFVFDRARARRPARR